MPSQSRSARQLPRKRGSQNETFRLLPPTRAGEVARRAGEGSNKQCGGQPFGRPPQRDPIFRDAKVLLFWCDQQQKELLVR